MDRAAIGDFFPGRYLKMSTTPIFCDRQTRGRKKKTNLGLRTAPAPMRDLSTIASFRAVALLRRHGPVPGILAARRPGAIMDKSAHPRLLTSRALNQQKFPLKKEPKKCNP